MGEPVNDLDGQHRIYSTRVAPVIEGRIVIIPFLHGKIDADGILTEPDIDAILEKWLQRHSQFRGREFHIIRSKPSLQGGIPTAIVWVTVDFSPDLADYDPAEDADLYEDFLAEIPAFVAKIKEILLTALAYLSAGCGKSAAPVVDSQPFEAAVARYLDQNNMGVALKDIKAGPTVEGQTATLTASLHHATMGGPVVTWTAVPPLYASDSIDQ
jgi:hypothetical protein